MGNRVEDLETQVAELQAAVDGLTEELVESKERISQLESAREVAEADPETDSHAEFVPNASATAEAAEEASQDAAERTTEEADGTETADADDETEESDDIIVA